MRLWNGITQALLAYTLLFLAVTHTAPYEEWWANVLAYIIVLTPYCVTFITLSLRKQKHAHQILRLVSYNIVLLLSVPQQYIEITSAELGGALIASLTLVFQYLFIIAVESYIQLTDALKRKHLPVEAGVSVLDKR